jgi:CRISPR/Cas system-associated endoribonuclease Cas2
MVFENRVLRSIFEPKRDKVKGEWRKLHKEEPSIIRIMKLRRMRWAEHVTRMGEKRNACRLFVRKSEGKNQ